MPPLRTVLLLVSAGLVGSCTPKGGPPPALPGPPSAAEAPSTPTPPPPPCPGADAIEERAKPSGTPNALGAERIAAALCLVRNDESSRARKLLEPVLGAAGGEESKVVPQPLKSYAQLVAGEAAISLGEFTKAAELLSRSQFPEGPAERRLANLFGEALIRDGRTDEGRVQLARLLVGSWAAAGKRSEPNGGAPAEARWWLAHAARTDGEREQEIRALEDLWALHPRDQREQETEARLAELGASVPNFDSESGRNLVLRRIATLEATYYWKEALALRDKLGSPSSEAERTTLARIVLKARDYPRALALYEALEKPGARELFNTAVAATRTKNYPRATEIYRAIQTRFGGTGTKPKNRVADQASYKIGYLAYDEGSYEIAIRELKAHLKRYPRSRYAESARWFIAWSLIKSDRLDEAKGALGLLKQEHPRSSLVAASDYWTARIAGMQGAPETQRKGLEKVLEDHPVSSYAWFASQSTGKTWPMRPPPAPKLQEDIEALPAVRRGRALAAAGLDSWARAELRSLKPVLKRGEPAVVLAYAEVLAAAGAWAEARSLVKKRCRPAQDLSADPQLARICWPRPLGDVPAEAARNGGLSAHLPFAIMRAETGWKPWLTSPAGASGLMQVMPFLGESLTKELFPDRHWDPLDLYDPVINAELGVAELVSLNRRFEDSGVDPRDPLVIAGYNGGEKAVRRWLGLYDSPPPADVFAEDVGYTETRRYVRKVLATLMAYRYVYGDVPAAPEHP